MRSSSLARREFLKLGAGLGLGAVFGWSNPAFAARLGTRATFRDNFLPRDTARNCVFIFLNGAPSHIDTFDLKVGRWTPSLLGVERLSTGIDWPSGLLPKLAQRTKQFSLVRSIETQEAAHERAQYYLETGRRLNPGLRNEIPNIGALVAFDFEQQGRRKETDTFPGFMRLGATQTDNGFLAANFAPFGENDVVRVTPPDGQIAFDRRMAILQTLNDTRSAVADGVRQPLPVFQEQATKIIKDPTAATTFAVDYNGAEVRRYGGGYFAYFLVLARNTLKANRGTRFIEINQYGWDHHQEIYTNPREGGLQQLGRNLDTGLSAFIDDLAAAPGTVPGKSLFDETLIVVMGEFGRTVGDLNRLGGRDHYPYAMSALLAGGGVKGGRVIGATDDAGAKVKDPGWEYKRAVHLPDIVTTIYSALGINWFQVLAGTPSGRPFYYVDPLAIGDERSYEIAGLF